MVRLTLTIASSTNAGQSATIDVSETFDEVTEKIFPLRPASSALEDRDLMTYNKADGSGRIFLHRNLVGWAEEAPQDDD